MSAAVVAADATADDDDRRAALQNQAKARGLPVGGEEEEGGRETAALLSEDSFGVNNPPFTPSPPPLRLPFPSSPFMHSPLPPEFQIEPVEAWLKYVEGSKVEPRLARCGGHGSGGTSRARCACRYRRATLCTPCTITRHALSVIRSLVG